MDFPYLCHHNGILATDMKRKIYKAHILYTKEKDRFEVLENGYVAVDADGRVTDVSANLQSLDSIIHNSQLKNGIYILNGKKVIF